MSKYILFFVITLILSSVSLAESFVKLSLGNGIRHQSNSVSELSLSYNDWAFGLVGIGEGHTVNGDQEFNNIISATKELRFIKNQDFEIYSIVGLSSVQGSNLVGPWNYRSGFGFRFGIASFEYNHISSGSLYQTNQGIDWLSFNLNL